jgi:hypothetical protein
VVQSKEGRQMTHELTTEQKRILDDMLARRMESSRKIDADEVQTISELVAKGVMEPTRLRCVKSSGEIEAEVIQQILVLASGVPDDTPMIVGDSDGPRVAARTIRVWASFHCTPEGKQ